VPAARRHRRDSKPPDRRRALELLAATSNGVTETLLIAHGVTLAQMVTLIRDRLASAHPERIVAGGKTTEVSRVKITAAGRRALAAAERRR
jgi:hypothetical protein